MRVLILQVEHEYSLRVTHVKTRKAFLAYSRRKQSLEGKSHSGAGAAAKFFGYNSEVAATQDNIYGEILLYDQYFDFDCVAHEVAHFLIKKFKDKGADIYGADEEEFCKLQGLITNNILQWKPKADEYKPGSRLQFWDSKLTL